MSTRGGLVSSGVAGDDSLVNETDLIQPASATDNAPVIISDKEAEVDCQEA